jgi:hypothetical protein
MITQARLIVAGVTLAAILALVGYVYFTRKALREANARVTAAEQSITKRAARVHGALSGR